MEQITFSVATAVDSRFPRFQELDLEPERAYQDVAGTLEVDFFLFLNFGTVDLAVRKETTEQALPPALLLGIRRPEFLSRASVETEDTPSKVNYGTCHFPKCLFLYRLCTFVHTLFLLWKCSSLAFHLSKLPFSQYPTLMVSFP